MAFSFVITVIKETLRYNLYLNQVILSISDLVLTPFMPLSTRDKRSDNVTILINDLTFVR